jgi:hypothetical protein
MSTLAPTGWVVQLLQLLPGPLLRALDRWSHRRAVARQLQRQQAWLDRKAPVPVPLATQYKLKPWRD